MAKAHPTGCHIRLSLAQSPYIAWQYARRSRMSPGQVSLSSSLGSGHIRTISTYLGMSADEIPDDLTDYELTEMVAWTDRLTPIIHAGG